MNRREFLIKSGKAAALTVSMAAAPTWLQGCGQTSTGDYDLVFRNGTVYDGTLTPPFNADVAIKGDRIVAMGTLPGKTAKTIDVTGLIVAPGFIDIHTHCDLTFSIAGTKRYLAYFMPSWKGNHNYLFQGVTTVVTGNCGLGYANAQEWFDIAQSVGFGTNICHLAPHGMIRQQLFGADQPGELSSAQLTKLKDRVVEEMDKGVIGLSAGLEYSPGLLASTGELIEVCKVVQAKGGLFTIHMRDESGQSAYPDRKGLLASLQEVFEIARRAEIPVEISHLKIATPFGRTAPDQVLDLIEKARLEGLAIHADQYPYEADSTFINGLLPDKYKTTNGVKPSYLTAAGRTEIRQAIEYVFSFLSPDKVLITMDHEHKEYDGKTLVEIGKIMNKTPAEAYVELVCQDPCPVGVFFLQDIKIVHALTGRDYIITASDGWTVPKDMSRPHPRTYGTFPKKLRRFAMEAKLLTLNQAIRSMTSLPAEKLRIKDRGRLAPGAMADLVVFNPQTINDRATYQEPHQYSEGVVHLMVNGVLTIANGQVTGDRGGRVLKRI